MAPPGMGIGSRNMPRDEEVFDIIVNAHLGLLHAGRDKTFQEIDHTTAGVSKKEVAELLKHCSTCAKKGSQKSKAPLQAIVENILWGRVQIDLIDMRGDPDGEYKWICHIRDHFSKYSGAYPMVNKTSSEVVKVVVIWIMHFGPPKILQSDNGTEFKGALSILLHEHGIKVINGRPRHSQSQGMVEQANGVLKGKIAAWRSDHQSASWVCSLPEVIAAMNCQQSSVTGRSAFEIVFGQSPHGERVSYLTRELDNVLQEGDLTAYSLVDIVNASVESDVNFETGHITEAVNPPNELILHSVGDAGSLSTTHIVCSRYLLMCDSLTMNSFMLNVNLLLFVRNRF